VPGMAFLTYQENIVEKFSAALGFLSGVIHSAAFCFAIEGDFSCALA
jgi:hypothetical protein